MRMSDHGVVLLPAGTEVVLLEDTRNFIESVVAVNVVHEVRRVEQLSHRPVHVLLGLLEHVVN